MADSNTLSGAPLFIQKRYGAIRMHVTSVIEEQFPRLDVRKIAREDREFIQLIALVYILRGFFEDGHRAALEAVRIFEDLDVPRFSIGSITFSKRSKEVYLGQKLAEELLNAVEDPDLRAVIVEAQSLGFLIRLLIEELEYA